MQCGECMAFVFLPMVFLGLYNLFNTEKNHYYLIFGACGLILSHNLSTMLTALFAFMYCLINIKNLFRTHVKKGLCIDIIFILFITSFFWMPLLETKFSADYRVYEENAMEPRGGFFSYLLSIKDLFMVKKNSSYVFEIGLPVISILVFSMTTIRNLEENKKEYLFFLVSGMVSVWMATKYFPWKWLPNCFYIIQFPWRMLLFSSFFFAIICSMNLMTIIRKFNFKDVAIVAMICSLYLFSKYSLIPKTNNILKIEDVSISKVLGRNNKEWLTGMGQLEYLPNRAYQNNSFYIATRENGISALQGNCEIQENVKIGTYMTAKIATQDETVKLELPYIYYPGYTVRFDGIILETFETENGFLGCQIEKNETGDIEVKYTGTRIMNYTKVISSITLIVCIIYVWKKH